MWTKEKSIALVFIFIFLFFGFYRSNAQVNESKNTPVYEYLSRMAQKGLINWQDWQTPLFRSHVRTSLLQLAAQPDKLSGIEISELNFYLQEYSFDSKDTTTQGQTFLFRKDSANRLRTFGFKKDGNSIFLDPVFGGSILQSDGKTNRHYFSGVRLGAYFGKHWGANFLFRDNTQKGDTLNYRGFGGDEDIVPTIQTHNMINYSSLNFNLAYSWSSGSLSVGQDNLAWGYGQRSSIILSGKAPAFPYIKLDYQPWSWLHFSYFHGWLHSNIIDSFQSYGTGTGIFDSKREIYRSKYIAHHAIVVTPVKGLDIGIGESIIYSDQLNIGYLIPVSFFRIIDHQNSRYNIKASDNSQFFGMISSRNHIRNTHLYAQFFVDEIRISKIFDPNQSRNQLGFTLGMNRTDLFLQYLTAGIEYSRVNPFVYNNLIPTQTYENHSYLMGDWMGNNADRLYGFLNYTPLPKLRIKSWVEKIRKGIPGTLDQQYFQLPQPSFLFSKLFDYKEAGASVSYEWLNRLIFFLNMKSVKIDRINATEKRKSLQLGFSYGL